MPYPHFPTLSNPPFAHIWTARGREIAEDLDESECLDAQSILILQAIQTYRKTVEYSAEPEEDLCFPADFQTQFPSISTNL